MTQMTISKAIRSGLICEGDFVNPAECFLQENKEILLEKEKTGFSKDQILKREENLRWVYSTDYNGLPTLFASVTDFELFLKGDEGYKNVEEVLNKASSLYTNDSIGFHARSLKEEDVNFFKNTSVLNKIFDNNEKKIGLVNTRVGMEYGRKVLGIRIMQNLSISTFNLVCQYFIRTLSFGICPVISLENSNIFVDIDSKARDGKWKLIPTK